MTHPVKLEACSKQKWTANEKALKNLICFSCGSVKRTSYMGMVLEEEHGEQDETWVRPSKTNNFTEVLNGSLVLGELIVLRDEIFPVMCSLSIEDSDVSISSAIFYDDKQNEYYAVEDMVKSMAFPLRFLIHLTINGEPRALKFTANKVDVYKNDIKMNISERY